MADARRQSAASRPKRRTWQERFADHRAVAGNSLRQLRKSPIANMLTILVIAIALLMPALLISINLDLVRAMDDFADGSRLNAFVSGQASADEISEVSDYLLNRADITSVEYISSDEALSEFEASSGLGDLLAELSSNPLPASLVITPANSDPATLQALAVELEQQPVIDFVQLDSLWLQRLQAISSLFGLLGRLLSAIMLLGLLLIVGNTIRLGVENRRAEIRVTKLVGGTTAYIARPFLYTGAWLGLWGGAVAGFLTLLVTALLNRSLAQLMQLYGSAFGFTGPGFTGFLLICLCGALAGWLSALLASIRHIVAINP